MNAGGALPDAVDRRRIADEGLDATLFVEAGAGTGKTSELVARVVNLVLSGRVRLRSVAAITFTEAAASELRDRLRVAFEQIAATATDPERLSRARQALTDADQAAITTLHGFALRILSEHPTAAGLPPRLQIADEVSSTLAFEDRWEHFVDRLYNTTELAQLLVRAVTLGIALEPAYPRSVSLKDVAAILAQSWDRLEALAADSVTALPAVDFAPYDRAVAAVEAARQACPDPDDRLAIYIDLRLPQLHDVAGIGDEDDKLQALGDAADLKPGNCGAGRSWNGDAKAARQLLYDVNASRDAVRAGAAHEVLQRFKVLIASELWQAAEARRRQGMLEFHDLLVLARRVLRASPATRASLSERFHHLLLDEFQDTDPLQIEIATLIAGAIADRPLPWRDTEVPPGRLFFVGDAKQSIYRFRRADIGLFFEARETFGAGASLVRLSTNFRTVRPILDWVNTLFGELMPDELPGRQPRYEPLHAHRDPSASDHRVTLLGGHVEGLAAEVRQAEATHVAAVIDDIRRRPSEWPVDGNQGWRPAKLSDVTILVPTRLSLPYLRAELDRHDIPYRLDTGTLVFDSQEVRDVLAVLRAIDDASDEMSLVAALRSPLYGCSDVDLLAWRQAGGRWSITRAPAADLADHPVGRAVAHLHSLWRQRWWSSPADLVDRVIDDCQAALSAFGDERPLEVIRRYRFLAEQARSFDAAGGGGIRAFCAWAALQASSSARVHEPLAADTDYAGVRVMTIHGAKGLEFPITILSGMSTQPSGQRTGVAAIWDGDQLEVRLSSKLVTEHFEPRAEVEDEMSESEWRRLLYVAATRAADHLVVSRYHGSTTKRSYGLLVDQHIGGRDGLHRPAPPALHSDTPSEPTPSDPPPSPADDRDEWLATRGDLLRAARRARVTSATAIATAAMGEPPAASAPPDDEVESGRGVVDEDQMPWRRGRAGTAIGRAVHASLQSLGPAIDADDPLIDEVAGREAAGEAVDEHVATVAAMVRSALASPAMALARAHPHWHELYVAADIGGIVVEGFVDLLIDTPEGLVIVDYKTDTVRSEDEVDVKLSRYELQGAAYALAVAVTTGRAVIDCRFVFCRPSGAIERSIADLDGACRRVEARLGEGVGRPPARR